MDRLIDNKLREALGRYVQDGIETGGFLRAVLENDLMEAANRADQINREELADIVQWVNDYCPPESWGSKAEVEAWLAKDWSKK